jgi:transcriptional regulator with XRE-family HTH domain
MDVCLVIKERLDRLGLEQKDLAAAAQVTDSYISQLLTRKKSPPAPDRTDLYERIGKFLKMPSGKLAKLAEIQRREELKKNLDEPPAPLFQEVRELVLRKCAPETQQQTRAIFEKQPFGELERLVTQNLLNVVKRVAREELNSDKWLRSMAGHSRRGYRQMRVMILEFLDTDVFHVSAQHCDSFLEPLIDSWEIDPATFGMNIVLNRRFSPGQSRRFEFVETGPPQPPGEEPGLSAFLKDAVLSGNVTQEEIAFLKQLRFKDKRPTPLYYYRELQNLRDPLHFAEKRGT